MFKRKGFTLIELLVVVTIIVVLLALLLPGMDKAISIASSTKCAATLYGWGLGVRQYSLDYRQAAMPIYGNAASGKNWWEVLAPYMGQPNFVSQNNETLAANICPEAAYSTVGGQVTAERRWAYGGAQGSYGINTWVVQAPEYTTNVSVNQGNYFGHLKNTPGDAPFLADSIWVNSWPDNTDTPTNDTYNGDNTHQGPPTGRFMNRFVIARHNLTGKAINMVFVDGSARNVKLGELWVLRWHKNSQPNSNHLKYFDP